jgi:hypothetical protein
MPNANGSASTSDQRERNNRFPLRAGGLLEFFQQCLFEMVGVGMHFRGDHFFFRGADKTQLAMSQVVFGGQRRPESAANYRARLVDLTGALFGVEHRTGLAVAILIPVPARFIGLIVIQQAGGEIAGKIGRKARDGSMCPFEDAAGTLMIFLLEFGQAFSQADGVELINGKHTHATLRAARPASQPLAAFLEGIVQGRIHNLDQLLVPGWSV